jgi:mRNA (2'-O-methyladenosine-N6-)-methyltransferase
VLASRHGTKEDCARLNGTGMPCGHIHFRRIIKPHTDVSLGDCSYLDTCRHMATCRFIHYEVDHTDAQRMRQGSAQLDPFARTATNRVDDDPFSRHYESQFVNCDIRTFPMQTLGKFPVRTRRSPRTRDLSARGTRATRPRRLR